MATKESLTEEIIQNARRDRKRLEAVADGLVKGYQKSEDDPNAEPDDEHAAAFAEEIAAVSDSLTRITHELVELVKIEKKGEKGLNPGKLPTEDVEGVYDQIQPEEMQ